jgi:hypothetical protein
MGFTTAEALKLTFKVQAGGVIDAASGNQWYESKFPFSPSINANRVLTQFDQVKLYPAANLAAAQSAAVSIPTIIEDRSPGTFSSFRLTQVTSGDDSTWVAYENYNDRSSDVLDLWIQPQRVPKLNGDPSIGYSIKLYSGTPGLTNEITTTVGQSGGEVGWVFNYDMGMLFVANDLITALSPGGSLIGTYPSGLDFYIRGFRYIGETLANATFTGGSASFSNSTTIGFTQSGPTYSFFVNNGSLTASQLNTGSNGGATAGYILSNTGDGNFAWVPAGAGGSTGTSSVEFHNTDTISFATQSIPGGLSASASINLGSLTASHLNTGSSGGATAGYVLSNTSDGNFQWIQAGGGTSLDVVDYITGETFSSVSTMIFRGGNVTVPVNATLAGATATGVSVTGPAPVVTVWIPAPNYVGYFTPSLGSGAYSRYISIPTTNGYNSTPGTDGYYGTGTWNNTTDFTNSTTRNVTNSSGSLTLFTESEFACYNTGTTMSLYLYNHDGSILRSIVGHVISGIGSTSQGGLTLNITSFSADNDRYKSAANATLNVGTEFPNGGRFNWMIRHNNGDGAGNTAYGVYEYTQTTPVFYDNDGSSSSAKISGGVNFDELTATTVYYSGVAFYAINSTFAFTASQIDLLNDITIPTTNQITLACTNLATSGSFAGYADGTKSGVGAIITGWTLDWNKSGLTYSRTLTVNTSSTYVPGFSTNNTISSSAVSYVTGTIYDYGAVGTSQSVSRTMLFDTYSPGSVAYNDNPLDSENSRLSMTGVMSSGSSAFTSNVTLPSDELQYIFGRVIYPQTNFTAFYPRTNWTSSVNYTSSAGSNKTFTVYTSLSGSGTTTTLTLNDYRWHVTSYGKDAAYSTSFTNGIFTFISNFTEADLEYNGVLSSVGTNDLVIIVGIDSSGLSTTPDKFLYVSGNPVTYATRQVPGTYNLNNGTQQIQWSKGTLSATVKKCWLFIGYKNTTRGKNINMTNIHLT